MRIQDFHLTYCTNIHAGETWEEIFKNISQHIPDLKSKLSPEASFGIGLRLSSLASIELIEQKKLEKFKIWLQTNDLYVFTINGFPYGGFHHQEVKDKVHFPDWTLRERLEYTQRLAYILSELLPENVTGGISTSPIYYKPWLKEQSKADIYRLANANVISLVKYLHDLSVNKNKHIHIDIEPEPDGMIENSGELIDYFEDYLLTQGAAELSNALQISISSSKEIILNHVQVCYDVCHFALAYENPQKVCDKLKKHNIKIGKIQISAALDIKIPDSRSKKLILKNTLLPFAESTYLHQVSSLYSDKTIKQYPDLPFALNELENTDAVEWRVHFHVPIFLQDFGILSSTQSDIKETIDYLKKEKFTEHLEIETYTWEVLPQGLKSDIGISIFREYQWVINYLNLPSKE